MGDAPGRQTVPSRDITSPYGDSQAKNLVFGDRLRAQADRQGLTAAALAQKLGITRGTMARYWHGERLPPAALLLDMAEELETDPQWLVRGRRAPERKHLVAVDEHDWVEVTEYDLWQFGEYGKGEPKNSASFRKDWLYTTIGISSGLWLTRLLSGYPAANLSSGALVFCQDIRVEELVEGNICIFRVHGGMVIGRLTFCPPLPGSIGHLPGAATAGGAIFPAIDTVFIGDVGSQENQYTLIARIVGQLARPI